ncbi:MAG: hypothetical protein ACTIC1_05730 [Brevibacterium sp.]|uniref:hypothetical protein n=1 Tax=Brevibacterium aurantiacum TaxID=273384 RepID=UPI003F8FEE40
MPAKTDALNTARDLELHLSLIDSALTDLSIAVANATYAFNDMSRAVDDIEEAKDD